ncbi:sensor histidine kinase [Patulibacter minatonensis]|uniref:sensor histidine kinase n=1 Tax=Patulibacter minatonensis TaxID=298163 RepID=UPI0004B34027|nr:histidine kinase [Patulibacter minatonensis]
MPSTPPTETGPRPAEGASAVVGASTATGAPTGSGPDGSATSPVGGSPRRRRQPWITALVGPERDATDGRRFGMLVGGIWLVYLAPAADQVVAGDWPTWQRVLGGLLLVVFVAAYLTTLIVVVPARRARSERQRGLEPRHAAVGDREMWARVALLLVVAVATSIGFGGEWLSTIAFSTAILAVWLDQPWPPRAIVGMAVGCEALLLVRGTDGDSSAYFWLGFAVLVAGFVSYAARRRGELEGELDRVREQNARLAVVEERGRIARDLHDLLGHSLSVIAVKSQLAERLLERDDAERAAAEIREVRGVARDALREVRHVVDGYRRRPIAAEVASSAAALRSADLDVASELPEHPIPPDVEDVLSFVVREGTTNVLRHSGASRCTLAVRAAADRVTATVADDGPASVAHRVVSTDPRAARPGSGDGSGLVGLAERLDAVGGTLELGPGEGGGTVLRATVPLRSEGRS